MCAAMLLSAMLSSQTPVQTPPEPIPLPQPARSVPLPSMPSIHPSGPPILTVEQFVAGFVAAPGIHQATIIHPCTKKPIDVVFRLPDQPLQKTYNTKNRITFDYGKTQVVLIFRLIGGKVDVRYD